MEVKDSAPETDQATSSSRYLPLTVVVVFAVLFFSTFQNLYTRWIKWDEGLSHGLLVIAVFLVLLIKSLPWAAQRQSILLHIIVCSVTAFFSLSWFLFNVLNIHLLEQLVLLPLLILVVAASFGIKTAYQQRFLLLLPIFAIPVWDQLTNILVNLSASIVGEMVRLIQMPALIDGNSIYIPYGHILIADGCSGLRYLVIALAIGYIIGYLNRYDEKRMLAVLAIAGLLGLIANWVRIFLLILIGYQTEMQSSLMADHETFGWIIFGVLVLPAIYFAPVVKAKPNVEAHARTTQAKPLLPLAALAVGPLCAILLTPQPKVAPWQDILPNDLQPAAFSNMLIPVLSPQGSHQENGRALIDTQPIMIQTNQYQRHTADEKLVPYISHLFNPDEWAVADTLAIEGHPAPVKVMREKSGLRRVAQVQWFEVGGHPVASVRKAKLMQIPALIKGSNEFRIITLQAECEATNCDTASAALKQLANNLLDKDL